MTLPSVVPQLTSRQRLTEELAADAGPGWIEGCRPGSPGCHELLDRVSLLSDMVERHLIAHPACIANSAWYAVAEQAAAALSELYQQIGADHLTQPH